MKKVVSIQIFLATLFLLTFSNTAIAQKLIARQNGGAPTFYTKLDSAVIQAANGDTLYIPGGYFTLGVAIDKELHMVGEGHNPKSSVVNGVTYIGSTFQLLAGASHSSFHGLYVEPVVYLTTGVNYLTFKRCNIYQVSWYSSQENHEYITFSEDIFREGTICPFIYSDFSNCIFAGYICHSNRDCTFRNNIFLNKNFPLTAAGYVDYSRFENNVFLASDGIHSIASTSFFNNLFVVTPTFDGLSLKGYNNLTAPSAESIFTDQTGTTFSYEGDYSLKLGSEGIKKGTDGKDIGLYGGPTPWKDGSVPFNPHVESKNVATYTDALGNLKVQIKVSSQER